MFVIIRCPRQRDSFTRPTYRRFDPGCSETAHFESKKPRCLSFVRSIFIAVLYLEPWFFEPWSDPIHYRPKNEQRNDTTVTCDQTPANKSNPSGDVNRISTPCEPTRFQQPAFFPECVSPPHLKCNPECEPKSYRHEQSTDCANQQFIGTTGRSKSYES